MVHALDDERNDIYIMIDKKSSITQFDGIMGAKSRVVFCKNRIKVYWGHVSQIENELNVFAEARQKGDYSYYHLLSGVCFPIKTQDYIHDFFKSHSDKEFIAISHSENVPRIMSEKLDHYHILSKFYRHPSRIVTGIARRIRHGFDNIQRVLGKKRTYLYDSMEYGSNWASMTQSFIDYLLANRKSILDQYKGTYCPDEVYKQTLAYHSQFRENLATEGNMRLIDWTRGGPYTWSSGDIAELSASTALFTRKVTVETATKITQSLL